LRGNHGLNEFGLVSPGAIPNDDASLGNVALELKQEFPSEDGFDVDVLVESKDKTNPAVLGRHNTGSFHASLHTGGQMALSEEQQFLGLHETSCLDPIEVDTRR
jgi:hypothetical protein